MYAAILHAVAGGDVADGNATLDSDLDRRPYADLSATEYLDGHTVYDGTLAGYVPTEQPKFYTDADTEHPSLHVETDEAEVPITTDVVADLEAGWAGVDAGDGADLLETILLGQLSAIPERTELDLPAIAETLPDDAIVEGVVTSEDADEDDRDAAAALWHDEAPKRHSIPTQGLSQLSIRYRWDGYPIHGTLAASGYVAIYSDITIEAFARWVTEVVWPNSVHEDGTVGGQTELGDDICAECGRESDDLLRHEAAPVDGTLCPVCRDQYDEVADGTGGEAA